MRAAVLTVSDRCSRGLAEDASGPALGKALAEEGWTVTASAVVADEPQRIAEAIRAWVEAGGVDLVIATGGTGISPRDRTPEAVRPLLEKEIPGLGELMRRKGLEKTPYAPLSRSLAGTLGSSLVLCLPGSPAGAVDSLRAVLPVLPHAIRQLQSRPDMH